MEYKLASSSWGKEEVQAMHDVIDSGSHSMGANVKKFEKEFAEYIGTKHAIMVNSGSSANLIGFHALKLLQFQIQIIKLGLQFLQSVGARLISHFSS